MLLPLILAVLDEILIRQRHGAVGAGVLLGLLVFAQFFLSTELLAIAAVVVVVSAWSSWWPPPSSPTGRRCGGVAPHAAAGPGRRRGPGRGAPGLAGRGSRSTGPAHLSGLVWPNVDVIGGFIPSSFVDAGLPEPARRLPGAGRLRGGAARPRPPTWAGASWPSWPSGLVAFWRDRRLWFFGFACSCCLPVLARDAARASGSRPGSSTTIPRDRERDRAALHGGRLPGRRRHAGRHPRPRPRRWRPTGGARSARWPPPASRSVPMAVVFGSRLPFAMQPVILPRWYSEVAPTLPPGRVLLSFPAPFSGIQSAMAWQAVNRMHYSQAGGGGPQGVARRAGSAARGVHGADACSGSASGCPCRRGPRPSSPRSATRWPCGRSTRW